MEKKIHTITITVNNRDKAFAKVNQILHNYSEGLLLRVGYPFNDKNLAVIFLIGELSTDDLGALSGKLGQIDSVKVKSTTLKINS